MERNKIVKTKIKSNPFVKKSAVKDTAQNKTTAGSEQNKDLSVSKEEYKEIEKSWDREINS